MKVSVFEAEIISGTLTGKNVRLDDAKKQLKIDQDKKFRVYHIGSRSFIETNEFVNIFEMVENNQRSGYYESFSDGATIYPRQFWFIDIVLPTTKLGLDPQKPNIKTSARAHKLAKKGYEDVEISGQVESQFLFHVATGSELVPFTNLELPICVLPIEENLEEYRITKSDEALMQGNRGLRDWLIEVEKIWKTKRGEKGEAIDVYEWLNYSNKLTNQNPKTKYKVLYNSSGTYLVASVIKNAPREIIKGGVKIRTQGLIADHKAFYSDTDNEDEAHYISAFLNAPIIDRLIKPLQSVGDFGERDIHKKVLELPIPRFEPGNKVHEELSDIAQRCQAAAAEFVAPLSAKYGSVGKIRREIKDRLRDDLSKIDGLAINALNASRPQRAAFTSLDSTLSTEHE
jgi:hypothetical protein